MIVKFPDPVLLTPTQPFDFQNPPINPTELAEQLIKEMHTYMGVGLAANQLGIPYRVFVIRGVEHNLVCFNPFIVHYSGDVALMEEACLSLPGATFKIKRPKSIRMRFQVPSSAITTQKFEGLSARIIQHEIDHLDGVAFYNRANRYHREKGLKNVR